MNLIVAVTKDYAIGKDNGLLFHLPKDLAFFKEKTLNKVIIMGEKTYYSLPKRPLPKRTTIVLSNNPEFKEDGVIIARSVDELFEEVKKYDPEDVFVCGGASVYNLLMDNCEKAFITKIDKIVPADTYIHNLEEKENWRKIYESETMEENGVPFRFETYVNEEMER